MLIQGVQNKVQLFNIKIRQINIMKPFDLGIRRNEQENQKDNNNNNHEQKRENPIKGLSQKMTKLTNLCKGIGFSDRIILQLRQNYDQTINPRQYLIKQMPNFGIHLVRLVLLKLINKFMQQIQLKLIIEDQLDVEMIYEDENSLDPQQGVLHVRHLIQNLYSRFKQNQNSNIKEQLKKRQKDQKKRQKDQKQRQKEQKKLITLENKLLRKTIQDRVRKIFQSLFMCFKETLKQLQVNHQKITTDLEFRFLIFPPDQKYKSIRWQQPIVIGGLVKTCYRFIRRIFLMILRHCSIYLKVSEFIQRYSYQKQVLLDFIPIDILRGEFDEQRKTLMNQIKNYDQSNKFDIKPIREELSGKIYQDVINNFHWQVDQLLSSGRQYSSLESIEKYNWYSFLYDFTQQHHEKDIKIDKLKIKKIKAIGRIIFNRKQTKTIDLNSFTQKANKGNLKFKINPIKCNALQQMYFLQSELVSTNCILHLYTSGKLQIKDQSQNPKNIQDCIKELTKIFQRKICYQMKYTLKGNLGIPDFTLNILQQTQMKSSLEGFKRVRRVKQMIKRNAKMKSDYCKLQKNNNLNEEPQKITRTYINYVHTYYKHCNDLENLNQQDCKFQIKAKIYQNGDVNFFNIKHHQESIKCFDKIKQLIKLSRSNTISQKNQKKNQQVLEIQIKSYHQLKNEYLDNLSNKQELNQLRIDGKSYCYQVKSKPTASTNSNINETQIRISHYKKIKVLTWNIEASCQKYKLQTAKENAYIESLSTEEKKKIPEELKFLNKNRLSDIVEEIKSYDPDIIFLQQVQRLYRSQKGFEASDLFKKLVYRNQTENFQRPYYYGKYEKNDFYKDTDKERDRSMVLTKFPAKFYEFTFYHDNNNLSKKKIMMACIFQISIQNDVQSNPIYKDVLVTSIHLKCGQKPSEFQARKVQLVMLKEIQQNFQMSISAGDFNTYQNQLDLYMKEYIDFETKNPEHPNQTNHAEASFIKKGYLAQNFDKILFRCKANSLFDNKLKKLKMSKVGFHSTYPYQNRDVRQVYVDGIYSTLSDHIGRCLHIAFKKYW